VRSGPVFLDGDKVAGTGQDTVLCGCDATEGIIAATLAGRFIRLFMRTERGVQFHDDPFHPFILVVTDELLQGFDRPVSLKVLSGQGDYRFMVVFKDWSDCISARDYLARRSGKTPTAHDAPYLFLSDPIHQHLLMTGKTFFKGMEFSALRRMALDIETDCRDGFEFSNPNREEDRILSLAVMDSTGYEEVLSATEMSETAMLERLGEIIRTRDPDVVEGHNIFRFDLEYIRVRAARLGVRLRWGRDGSEPKVSPSRFTVAEKTIDYPRCDIYGRSVVDTYFLVLLHDVGAREMESHGLKAAALHFGLAEPGRVYLAGDSIGRTARAEPELLARYNLDDVRETLALSGLLSQPYFLQSRMFPYSYQNCIIRGNATRINSLFLREYLRRGVAVPRPGRGEGGFEGGYADVFIHGVVGPVVHCDVAALYPSLLLSYRLKPSTDTLDLFLPLLAGLREFRLNAKRRAREEADPSLREHFAALQQAFKILINSFYGYLGSPLHNFSDPTTAARVARLGRETIRFMMDWLHGRKARVVELDTDGIYFIPPPGMDSPERQESLVAELSAALPQGIDVEMDGRYRAMFSYKSKNYALLGYDGGITIKGSALKSRGMEKYLREFTAEVIRLLLHGEGGKVEPLYREYLQNIREHRFDISLLAKTETLNESPDSYRRKVSQGKRNPSAVYELAARSSHEYRAGDQISYYITGCGKGVTSWENCRPVAAYDTACPDENSDFYEAKLKQARKKFDPFLDKERSLF
jgi:DNA polymerase elongation subunit (family B)